MSLENGAYEIYENNLRNKLNDESMNGSFLNEWTTTDLDRFGITSFAHKSSIKEHIEKLTKSPPKEYNDNNDLLYNEGNKPTAYI